MSKSFQSSEEPGVDRGSESTTGSSTPPADALVVALRALEAASAAIEALQGLGEVAAEQLPNNTDDDATRAVLEGHRALSLEASNQAFHALQQLGQRGAAQGRALAAGVSFPLHPNLAYEAVLGRVRRICLFTEAMAANLRELRGCELDRDEVLTAMAMLQDLADEIQADVVHLKPAGFDEAMA